MKENLSIYEFELTSEEIGEINKLHDSDDHGFNFVMKGDQWDE